MGKKAKDRQQIVREYKCEYVRKLYGRNRPLVCQIKEIERLNGEIAMGVKTQGPRRVWLSQNEGWHHGLLDPSVSQVCGCADCPIQATCQPPPPSRFCTTYPVPTCCEEAWLANAVVMETE